MELKLISLLDSQTEKITNWRLQEILKTIDGKQLGFKVAIDNPRRIKLRSHLRAKENFKNLIQAELGVSPLTIIHASPWNDLCQRAGLFQLHIDHRGGVTASARYYNDLKRTASGANRVDFLFSCWMFSMVMYIGAVLFSSMWLNSSADACIWPWIILAAVSAALFSSNLYKRIQNRAHKKIDTKIKELNLLFPNLRSPEQGDSIAVDFIDPPTDILEIITKLHQKSRRFNIWIAAHPDAFTVNPNDRVLAWADPIITVVDGDCVAILAQYGEFPEEKKLNELVKLVDIMPF